MNSDRGISNNAAQANHQPVNQAHTPGDPPSVRPGLSSLNLSNDSISAGQWQQLCEIALDLSLSDSYKTAQSLLLSRLCQSLGWCAGEFWLPPALSQSALFCGEAWYADEPDRWQEFRQLSTQIPFASGVGLPGRVWANQTLELLSAAQLQLEPLFPRASLLRGLDIQTAIGLPLQQGDHGLGVMVLFSHQAIPSDDPAIDWLSYLLDRLTPLLAQQEQREPKLSVESRYRSIVNSDAEGVFQATLDGHYISANQRLAQIYGYGSPEELLEQLRCCDNYVQRSQRQAFLDRVRQSIQVEFLESQVYRKDGSIIWVWERTQSLRDAAGQVWGYIGTVEDVTDRKWVELELIRRDSCLQGLAEATHILLNQPDLELAIPAILGIIVEALEVDRSYIYAMLPQAIEAPDSGERQPGLKLLFEHCRDPIQAHRCSSQTSPIDWTPWLDRLRDGQSILHRPGSPRLNRSPDIARQGEAQPNPETQTALIGIPIFIDKQFWGVIGCETLDRDPPWSSSRQSVIAAIAASLGGIFKRQQVEQEIQHQAFHDSLTGLPNRLMFNHRMPGLLAHARRTGETLAVIFLDLDRFKSINDSLGHDIGDQLLNQATNRMLGCLRQEDILARWGGDEFTLCLPNLRSNEDVARICQRMLDAIRQPFAIEGHSLQISISIGIALFPQDGDDLGSLLRNADSALYRVKEAGRDHYRFYRLGLNEQSSRRLALEQELQAVLNSDQLQLYYQPQIDLRHQQIYQWEVLLRWQHPDYGLLLPAEFLPLAESLGMTKTLGEWVLRQACAQLQQWQQLGHRIRLGINLAGRQFQASDLVTTLSQILAETQIASNQLVLEVTESMLIKDIDGAIAILQALGDLGLGLALDDFGSGYSSLDDLKRLPIGAIKIDSRFIHGLPDGDDRAIVAAILALGQGLNLQVIAEGVESPAQLNCLVEMGCSLIQGQLLYGAMSVEAATTLIESQISTPSTKI
jgi:diguanylate cyclase (GGDEF)-like protein/PAS domain S-box-containing protein